MLSLGTASTGWWLPSSPGAPGFVHPRHAADPPGRSQSPPAARCPTPNPPRPLHPGGPGRLRPEPHQHRHCLRFLPMELIAGRLAATSSPSAACSTRWSPAAAPSRATPKCPPAPPSSATTPPCPPTPARPSRGDLEKILARCLRKEPTRRFQHVDDVRVASSPPALPRPSRPGRPPPGPQIVFPVFETRGNIGSRSSV